MNKISLVALIFTLCCPLILFSQKRDIRNNVSDKNIKLLERLRGEESKRQFRIDSFLQKNPNTKKRWIDSKGGISVLYDIRNGRPIYKSTMNVHAATATKTRPLQVGGTSGLNLDGDGLTIGVWDGGPVEDTHDEFVDTSDPENPISRVEVIDITTTAGEEEISNHATHVSGTIAAHGADPNAKGMAPKARIKSYNFLGDEEEVLVEVLSNEDAIILSNHSYGVPIDQGENGLLPSYFIGAYEQEAHNWDEILYLNPGYLMVKSAGNSGNTFYEGALLAGFDKLTTSSGSKNNLVIANANPQLLPFSTEINSLVINSSSSKGPTDDMRIKPDIAADGTQLYSSVSGNSYSSFTGTSMSAPNTTGSLALIQQYYNQQNGSYMLAATLKGLVIHTAIDDDQIPNPDPVFGWGFLNTLDAVTVISNSLEATTAKVEELVLNEGEEYIVYFSAVANTEVKATLSWTDPPGAISEGFLNEVSNDPTPALVNDLDIKITASDGTVYYPWRLEFPNEENFVANRGVNDVDNVERIDFLSPLNDNYTLTISHKGKLLNDVDADPAFDYSQNFSVILSGEDITLNLPQSGLKNIRLYPNPAVDETYLEIPESLGTLSVEIFGINGRLHKFLQFEGNTQKNGVPLDGIDSGLYLLKINSSVGTEVRKLLVRGP